MNARYRPEPFWPELGEEFYDPVSPARFPKAVLRYRNQEWAERIGLGDLSPEDWQKHFWAFEPLPENLPRPLALRYHGHQFLHYNPDLGDGRGFLFAQMIEADSGRALDLGTKGSGQTPWSRRGDGRLTLKGAVREILATEMLEALGVSTSKTFSVFETGEELQRGDEPSPTRSAVLTRLNHGNVRIGTFQRLAHLKDVKGLEKLFKFCLKHYYPSINASSPDAILEFFGAVAANVAKTTARWMMGGFVHGVLNTDNINITGESFDYGPFRFLPHYELDFTAAYFDHTGLYAYGQQPRVLMWNLEQLMNCLAMVKGSSDGFETGFVEFQQTFSEETFSYFQRRLNITADSREDLETLFMATLKFLETSKVPFEPFFFDWFGGAVRAEQAKASARAEFYRGEEFEKFFAALGKMRVLVPDLHKESYFQKPQPAWLHIDEIERIWAAIDQRDDWSQLEEKLTGIRTFKKIFAKTSQA